MARDAEGFGFKVYFGDGTRLDVLHAAGAHQTRVVLVCVDDQAAATRIVEHLKTAFPHARVVARSRDREHSIELRRHGVDREVRETFEAAMALGRAATQLLGATDETVAEIEARVRRNDAERLELEWQAACKLAARRFSVTSNMDTEAEQVVRFWREAGEARRWFTKDAAFDRRFRARFLDLHLAAARRELDTWANNAEAALALLVLLDQYPRNAFRGTPHMYATDAMARQVGRQAAGRGHAAQVDAALRLFFCLPFAHSEDLADQEVSVELNAQLGPEARRHAEGHRDIVRRFGRFPHRNAILGRESTADELAFLHHGGFTG